MTAIKLGEKFQADCQTSHHSPAFHETICTVSKSGSFMAKFENNVDHGKLSQQITLHRTLLTEAEAFDEISKRNVDRLLKKMNERKTDTIELTGNQYFIDFRGDKLMIRI